MTIKQLLRNWKFAAIGLVVGVFICTAHADVVVVVSSKSTLTGLSNNRVEELFLGRESTFPNGEIAIPVDQSEHSPVRDFFYLKITGRTLPQMKSFWAKLIFTGQGYPPKEIGDDLAVRRAIANDPHLIGYIDDRMLDPSVKVVLTLRQGL